LKFLPIFKKDVGCRVQARRLWGRNPQLYFRGKFAIMIAGSCIADRLSAESTGLLTEKG